MLRSMFRAKRVEDILKHIKERDAAGEAEGLRRDLSAWSVTLLGVGAIIGAGIFATIGTAAAGDAARPGAGPSLMLSLTITAVVCGFTALCYAEFASAVPISGSAYTYSYATLGELVAWVIGWNLTIEYAIGNVAVAISWSNYFRALLENLGIFVPAWLAIDYRTGVETPEILASAPRVLGIPVIFNALAVGIVALITGVLVWGIRESARFNAIMVYIKILVLVFFVGVACWLVSPARMAENWTPFQPNGWGGTFAAAAVMFFAYIGFDAVSTVAEETRTPARDLPIGILGALGICTGIYIVVAAVFTGIVPYAELMTWTEPEKAEPLTKALAGVAKDSKAFNLILAFGAVVSTTGVLLVFQLGQPRIFMSMARDGLLPGWFGSIHPRLRTPHVGTILTGLLVGGFAAFARLDEMVDLTNIGTLFAFLVVCLGIPILRRTHAPAVDGERAGRAFLVPGGPYLLPGLGAVSCLFLAYYLPPASWWRLVGWIALGMAVYFGYGYANSVLGRQAGRPSRTPWTLQLSALGFVALAAGLIILPHDLGIGELWGALTDRSAERHGITAWSLGLTAAGLGCAVGGLAITGRGGRPEAP